MKFYLLIGLSLAVIILGVMSSKDIEKEVDKKSKGNFWDAIRDVQSTRGNAEAFKSFITVVILITLFWPALLAPKKYSEKFFDWLFSLSGK